MPNPMSEALSHVWSELRGLTFRGALWIPSTLTAFVLLVVCVLLVVLWPYGLIAMMENLVRGLMADTGKQMASRSMVANMPFVITIGMFFLVWLPFWTACLPMLVVGSIGSLFAKQQERPSADGPSTDQISA
jgi:hypothetical protein